MHALNFAYLDAEPHSRTSIAISSGGGQYHGITGNEREIWRAAKGLSISGMVNSHWGVWNKFLN